jgi:hypothetical protein
MREWSPAYLTPTMVMPDRGNRMGTPEMINWRFGFSNQKAA